MNQTELSEKAQALHRQIVTIDSHCDTPTVSEELDFTNRDGSKVNIPLMQEGMIDCAFMAVYIPQGPRDEESIENVFNETITILRKILRESFKHPDSLGVCFYPEQIKKLKNADKKAVVMAIENGYAFGKSLEKLERFYQFGVRYITLCHNGDNDICDSAFGSGEWGGLSPFGRNVVRDMNDWGMMIDVSHSAVSTFYDVLKYSQKPVIASHSSCRALCDHGRNLDDEQIKALAEHQGVMQIALYKEFINNNPDEASIDDAIKHIRHVVDLVGIDYVGIGSDFDGGGELIGCRDASELIRITEKLIAEGFDDESIAKIWGGNLMRVMEVNKREGVV
ncbi:MAG: dipeptidase [Tannerella sp.]|jgi:microsomal dipeptidase-like Zn-dependent dipeptidase|nr:dipeptidase [Tannerella sp.]